MRQLLVVGIDGATWDIMDPLLAAGRLPHIAGLIDHGTRSTMTSTVPPFTAPAWTSIVTGLNPGRHGIYDFFQLKHGELVFANSRQVKGRRLWDAFGAARRPSIVANLPVFYPPEAIDGVFVSGMLTPSTDSEFVLPAEHRRTLLEMGYEVETLSHNLVELVRAHTFGGRKKAIDRVVAGFDRAAAIKTEAVLNFMAQVDWGLTFIMYEGPDRLQHYLWQPETMHALESHYVKLDELIGELMRATDGERTVVALVSDHGLGPLKKMFYVNTWLHALGYTTVHEERAMNALRVQAIKQGLKVGRLAGKLGLPVERLLTSGLADRQVETSLRSIIDFPASQAYAPSYSACGIVVTAPPADYESVRSEIIDRLSAVVDAETNLPVMKWVKPREAVFTGPCVGDAPDIVFLPQEGTHVSEMLVPATTFLRDRNFLVDVESDITMKCGDHTVDGIFAISGPGIRRGVRLTESSVLDFCPTVLAASGLPVPDDLDGSVLAVLDG